MLTLTQLRDLVAQEYGLAAESLCDSVRGQKLTPESLAKRMVCFLADADLKLRYAPIARFFSIANPATVKRSIETMERQLEKDPALAAKIERIRARYPKAPA